MNNSFINDADTRALDTGRATRLRTLVEAGARMFALHGFARTQMADIAREAGVAMGTPYRYAESKEAFFDLGVRYGFGVDPLEGVSALPVPERDPGQTLAFLEEFLHGRGVFRTLERAIDGPGPGSAKLARVEAARIVGAIYDEIDANHLGFRIVDRSAREWPALAELFFQQARQRIVVLLERYIARRIERGSFGASAHAGVAARHVLETCAWFAMHRRR